MQKKKILIAFFLWVCVLTSLTSAHTKEKNTDKPVFAKDGNIFLKVNGQLTQLTNTGRDFGPVLSPDDRLVAFTREIEGKSGKCAPEDESANGDCARYQLWVTDIETRSERMLVGPRADDHDMRKVVIEFNDKKFSPDGKTIYFSTPAWAVSHAVHSVDIDGSNERHITHGDLIDVVNEPLSEDFKEYVADILKEDDWRIYPKKTGVSLIPKALKDDVKGYLIIETSGIQEIVSSTPLEDAVLYKDGTYHKSMGRTVWIALVNPDGSKSIPLEEGYK